MTTTVQPPSPMSSRPEVDLPAAAMVIDGQERAAESGRSRPVLDPSTGDVVMSVPEGGSADIAAAANVARRAFDEGPWRSTSARDRGRVLLRAAALLRERAEQFARLESLDAGKPITFSRMIDVATSADFLEYYGALAMGIEGSTRETGVPMFAYTLRQPVGVVAAVTPFNFPLILSMSKIAPALAAGNTVIHKPAEDTPLTALATAALLADAGLPDGVLNVVTGGPEAGATLVADARVDKIAFTGSTAVGRQVAAEASRDLKRVTVELGGKSAHLVFADADLEKAVQACISGFVYNTGQFCMAGSRILVERPVLDDVVGAIAGAMGHVPLGDPFDEGTVIGPMAGARHAEKVAGVVSQARATGARVIGGETANGVAAGGWYHTPTLITEVAQDSSFVQEEIFGPVVTVQPFDAEDEAVALANGTRYGLAAGLQTRDIARAHRVAARLDAGLVWVNQWGLLDVQLPFGGCKQSGHGRENGPEGLDAYLQTKSVLMAV